jgi:5-methyltetrahydrofolate--homocysteine methyltransferase
MMGEVSEEELYISYMEQSIALEKGGADVIIIETFSEIEEAVIAVQAAKENTSCEIICTMTFNRSQDGKFHTMMGVTPETMTNKILYAGADIIGANCGNGAEIMISIVNEIRSINQAVPVIVQANAGMPIYNEGKTVYPEKPEETASFLPRLINAGVNIFGGCCGTTPKHIQAIKDCLTR